VVLSNNNVGHFGKTSVDKAMYNIIHLDLYGYNAKKMCTKSQTSSRKFFRQSSVSCLGNVDTAKMLSR
jgi:hypothetical protein